MSADRQRHGLPTREDLEAMLVNNADLDALRAHVGRFNPIKTMGMERMEIRHSAILAWLLSPQETHGLGDSFLKAFLAEALRGHDSPEGPTALDVSQADMMDAEVRREWRHIDVLVLSPRNGWVFIIENKFDSGQHTDQLKRYIEVVSSTFKGGETDTAVRGIFLSLWGDEPDDPRYALIDYASICTLLRQVAFSGRLPLMSEVETFLKHYLEVILEATGMNDEQKRMESLARQLYRDHKRVLDFIVEHGKSTDFTIACETVFGEELDYRDVMKVGNQEFVYNTSDSHTFSFLPKSWFDALGGDALTWPGCENYWEGFPVIMWLQLTTDADGGSGQVRLYAEVGPLSDHDFRRELIESISEAASEKSPRIGFQRGARDEGKKYSKFFMKNSFRVDDIHDHDRIADAIKKALNTFEAEIDAISAVLPNFRRYGQKKVSE